MDSLSIDLEWKLNNKVFSPGKYSTYHNIRINDKIVIDDKTIVNLEIFSESNYIKLSVGKKTLKDYCCLGIFFFADSKALVIKRGVNVLIGLTVVFNSSGFPLTLKLIPKKFESLLSFFKC